MRRSQPRTFDRNLKYPISRDANGRALCRWDQKPVPKGRRAYCSNRCQFEVDLRTNAQFLRNRVKERDKGICAECGCDTKRVERVISFATTSYGELMKGRHTIKSWRDWPRQMVEAVFISIGFNRSGHLWEADHIVEVSAGGDCNLENMQTLCIPCHKAKTKRMHAERAQARRDARRGLLDGPTDILLELANQS